jgi:hypothetical protein
MNKKLLFLLISPLTSCCSDNDFNDSDGFSICGNLIEEADEECDSDSSMCSECKYPRMIFINTSRVFSASDIGKHTLIELDEMCEKQAIENNLHTVKTWKAWISRKDYNIGNVIYQSPGLYANYAGDILAYSFEDLTDGSINKPILYDQLGNQQVMEVWTGTLSDGTTSNANCDNWTLNSGFFGTVGKSDTIVKSWTSNEDYANCADSKYFYCVESDFIQ